MRQHPLAWGGLMMAQNWSTPYMPKLEMVKDPPCKWRATRPWSDEPSGQACGSMAAVATGAASG